MSLAAAVTADSSCGDFSAFLVNFESNKDYQLEHTKWPVSGREHPDYFSHLRSYFEQLNLGYLEIRKKYDLHIWEGFMCHRCAYMQLECDIDREVREVTAA